MTWWSLLGSGEFQPWSEVADRWLLDRAEGDGRVLILPTASAPEGDGVFDRWASMGLEHFASLGMTAEVVRLKVRLDAEDRLRRGQLKVLVATASLERGIDIGHVDHVCQIS